MTKPVRKRNILKTTIIKIDGGATITSVVPHVINDFIIRVKFALYFVFLMVFDINCSCP